MVLSVLLVGYFVVALFLKPIEVEVFSVLQSFIGIAAAILSLFVLNFLVENNGLGRSNSFVIFSYVFFIGMIPLGLVTSNIVIANFFIFLALRRILSLSAPVGVKKKILDAAILISVASIFYFWAILFFVILFLGILYYAIQDYRNWIIPSIGWITVFIIAQAATVIFTGEFLSIDWYSEKISFSLEEFQTVTHFIGLGIPLLVALFFLVVYGLKFKRWQATTKPGVIIVLCMLLIAFATFVFAEDKDISKLFLLAGPVSIMAGSFFQSLKKGWLKEFVLVVMTLLSFAAVLLQF